MHEILQDFVILILAVGWWTLGYSMTIGAMQSQYEMRLQRCLPEPSDYCFAAFMGFGGALAAVIGIVFAERGFRPRLYLSINRIQEKRRIRNSL